MDEAGGKILPRHWVKRAVDRSPQFHSNALQTYVMKGKEKKMIRKFGLMGSLLVILSILSLPIAAAQGPTLQGGNPSFEAIGTPATIWATW